MFHFEQLQLNDRQPVYLQLADHVKRQILLGYVSDGDSLPSRREIAMQTNVNPNTVQKACKRMEEEGYVVTDGNRLSTIRVTPQILEKIQNELMLGICQEFVDKARQNKMTYKQAIDMISALWDE